MLYHTSSCLHAYEVVVRALVQAWAWNYDVLPFLVCFCMCVFSIIQCEYGEAGSGPGQRGVEEEDASTTGAPIDFL